MDYVNNYSYSKCAVIGCGNVGAAIAYTLMQDTHVSKLVMIDINRKLAMGEAADISHGMSFSQPMKIVSGDYNDIRDCGIVIVTAGVGQKPGERRGDLTRRNAAVVASVIREVKRVNDGCILLMVTNPVDVLTGFAARLSGFDRRRVIGSGTVLDSGRLRYVLAERLKIDNRNIHAMIVGEHGDGEFPLFSSANVAGVPLTEFCALRGMGAGALYDIFRDVRDAAYEIIENKGATAYGIAMAVKRIVSAVIRDEKSILPISAALHGEYGIDGATMSIPCIVGRGGAEKVIEVPMNDGEREQLLSARQAMAIYESTLYEGAGLF